MQHNYHPLLQSQLGVFIECMQYPDCTQYNLPIFTPLGREVDMDRMERAFHVIYDSRVAWRIRFGIDEEGTPYQYEDDGKEFRVVRREMSNADFYDYAHHAFIRPFDLMGDEPLVRVELVSTEVQDYLLMDVHHLIMDGMSYTPIWTHQVFTAAYQYGVLPVETYSLLDAADDEQQSLHGDAYEKARDYYAAKYSDVDFATLSLRPVNPLGQMLRVHESVGKVEIDTWCKEHGVAVNLLFQAAFSYVMSVLLREDRIAYTTVSHGRFDKRWRNIFGMFSREMPVMSEVKDGQTVLDYIKSFRAELMSTIRYAAYPITDFCKDLKKMPGVCFNFQGMEGAEETLDMGTESYLCYEQVRNIVTNDMNVLIFPMQNEYDIRVESSDAHNSLETMQMVARAIGVTLQKMMQQPDAAVKSLPIVSEEEELRLIELGTGERLEYDRSRTFIDLFKEQVAKTPDSIAVVDATSQLTYKGLDEASDEYAKSVTPGTFVCVEMPRVKEFVVAVIGIWKAGSAYVPIDMEYPEERKRFMRKECDGKPLPQQNVAYMIYTSGSTGKPKGVMVCHEGLLSLVLWNNAKLPQGIGTRHLIHSSFSFDASVFEFVCPLGTGGEIHILDEQLRYDMHGMMEYIHEQRITAMTVSTQLGAELLRNNNLVLDYMMLAGEKIPCLSKPNYRLLNGYGPTEFTVCSSYYEVIGSETVDIPIGRPVPNSQSFICDKEGKLLPQGVAGELCLTGPQIAIGYWNNPELTAERFAEVTINDKKERIYKTGDLCRWNSEGQLEYIGRIDNQIKLRGYRIELGEIESAAMQMDGIKQVVAVVKDEQIVLYYVNETACAYEYETLRYENLLRSNLSLSLPEYMVPSVYVHLDTMPLTPNGKIDRKALPEPECGVENIVLPATKAEQDVLEVVEGMMEQSPISVTANLISLGLSSISAMRLAMRISQQLGKTISMSQLMSLPTIRDIAANLKNADDDNLGKVREKQEYYPLTDNQLGVYLDWEQHREGLQYNVPTAIILKGYDANRLQTAVSDVIAAHPYLFAQLAMVDGEVKIRRTNSEELTVNIEQLTIEPTAGFFQSRVRPFNLFEDRLFRFEIYTYGAETYLFMDIHHIITDGVSDAKLMSEIFAAYNGEAIETETYTAYDRAIEEQEIKESPAYTEASTYYTNLLSGVDSTVYPHSTDNLGEGRAKYVQVSLDRKDIESHSASLGVTPSNYLLTVFMEVLKRVTRETRVMITTVNSGREHAAMQDIQGFFVKTLPVVSENTVAEVQKQLIESISHECYPLTEMVQILGIHPEIMYAYEGGLMDDEKIRGVNDLTIIPLALDTAKVPLTLTVNPEGNHYALNIEYDDALYNEQDMQTLLHSIVVLAENYAKETSASLQDCSMLTVEEEHRLIELGTGERQEYDRSKTFIDLFKEQVAKTPDSIAVVDATSQITYKELDEASDEYAKSVTPGTFVCVEMPRVKEFVVAVIGIWKAGSAYVPIDMEYPEERKRFMREECDGKPLPQADVAYMIYTSGSTGQPKGVMIQHSSLLHFIQFISKEWHLTEQSRISCHSNFAFDASVEDLYPVLTVGGTMYIIPEDVRMDITMTYDYIVKNGITGGCYSTQFAQLLLQQYPNLPVEYLVLGGEKMTNCWPHDCHLINTYGPTECTVDATYYCLEQGEEYTEIPIGKPLANLNCYIADSRGHLMPLGAVGELCIAGPQLALGYYCNPELTAERFIEVTINGKTERFYKTGDLCRWNSEGQLEYIGRIDNQIKLRGYRIELGEIESAAMQMDGIKQAVAVVKDDQIVLYYVNETACAYEDETLRYENLLRSNLSLSLPEYMVPSVYVHLDTMPLTPNGKIDRKALPEPEYGVENIVLPTTKDEQDVLEVVERMMEQSPISVTANLISLGLSSISAMRLAMHLSQQLGKSISMSQLMASPTIRDIAANLKNAADDNLGKVREKQEYYPLTDNQLGVYLDWEQHRDGLQYNVPTAIKLKGHDANRLQKAVSDVIAAHPYLFAQLAMVDGEVKIRRADGEELTVSIEQLTIEPTAEFFQSRVRPFNLFEDSLFRFEIYTYAEGTYLFKDIHHIITDGVSDAKLMSEIFAAYNGEPIETETYTAYDRAIEEQEIKESPAYTEASTYYTNLLSGVESTVYPHSVDHLGEGRARYVQESLDRKDVESHSASLGVTPSNYLLTVFMEVLKRVTRETRVMITTVNSGREHAAMQDIQGFFVKTLPVVSADNVADIQKQLIESISHECYPLTEMVQTLGIHPEIMYAYEGGLKGDEKIRGINDLTIIPLALDTAKVPLTLSVNPEDHYYALNIEYDDALYNEQDMQTLLHSIIVLAENYAKGTSNSLQECSMLTDDEEQRLIELGTGEELEYDRSKTFIDLFKAQAKNTPEAIAVVDYCSQLTYKEIDEASDEYAKSVTPGTFVCVEMPRVKEFVVAVLGIWKAGSAYVPIDMEYPEERKRFIREECDGKPLPQADIAYMIYTSGSTGHPKGVMIQHSSLLNFIQFIAKEWHLTEQSRICCHSNFAFDASIEDLYTVLTVGGTMYIVPEDVRMDITMMHDYIVTNRINGGSYSTQFAQLLLQQYPHLPVEYLVLGGEKMAKNLPCDCRLINAYGPTECTVDATYYCFESGKDYSEIPIGRPLANLNCYIIDRQDNLIPQGTVGELCISGPQLALGYYNNSELTADRFIEVTINGRTERIYKTGDLCRWNNEGQLEYIGRIDNQVKLRGFRIELGEIESAAMQIDGIKQAVAAVKNERIILYYTSEEMSPFKGDLEGLLPEYMVPSVYVHLDAMPLTPNDKIDRKALPEPKPEQNLYLAPVTRNEKMLCQLIGKELGIEQFSVEENLVYAGMNSIKAMRISVILQKHGFPITMGVLVKSSTVRELSRTIETGNTVEKVGEWLNTYDEGKPCIVLCCGIVKADLLVRNMQDWKTRYNVYVLQPVFNSWPDYQDLSYDDLLVRYGALLEDDIPQSIDVFFGFSFGGELAYHLAERWKEKTGQQPLVLMGDTFIEKEVHIQADQQNLDGNDGLNYDWGITEDYFDHLGNMPYLPYPGKVILISAVGDVTPRDENEENWKRLLPDIEIIRKQDTHMGIGMNEQYYKDYLAYILQMK